jgi:hypothetical protein
MKNKKHKCELLKENINLIKNLTEKFDPFTLNCFPIFHFKRIPQVLKNKER